MCPTHGSGVLVDSRCRRPPPACLPTQAVSQYQTVATPLTVPAANKPRAAAATVSMTAPSDHGAGQRRCPRGRRGSNTGLSAMATKGRPALGSPERPLDARRPSATEPTTTWSSPQLVTASASDEPAPVAWAGPSWTTSGRRGTSIPTLAAGPGYLHAVPARSHWPVLPEGPSRRAWSWCRHRAGGSCSGPAARYRAWPKAGPEWSKPS